MSGDSLGVWTNVAGNRNNFVITGEALQLIQTPQVIKFIQMQLVNLLFHIYLQFLESLKFHVDYFVSKSRNIVASVVLIIQ